MSDPRGAPPEVGAGGPGLSVRLLIGWACGAFTTSVLVNSVGLLHLRFMTDSLGIAAAVAGSLVGLSKLYDGLTDPVMGAISDRTRSRWGPRRPYLFTGAVLCAASMYALFHPPAVAGGMLIGFMVCALLLFSTAYTMFRIPYLAMGVDLTRGFDERSKLIICNVQGSSAGSLVSTTLAPFLLAQWGSDRHAHALTSTALAALILVAGIACFRATDAAPTATRGPEPRFGWGAYVAALKLNRPFLALITYKTIMFTGLTIHLVAIPYFTRHALHASDRWLGSAFLMQTVFMLLSQFGWRVLARARGRRATAFAASLFAALVMLAWLAVLLVPHPEVAILALGALQGMASGGLFFGIQTMLPDTMEYDLRATGQRREGLLAGAFVMVEKLTSAVAVAVFGALVGALGYVASKDAGVVQPAAAIRGIYLAVSVLPAALALCSCLALRRYELSEDQLQAAGPRPAAAGAPAS